MTRSPPPDGLGPLRRRAGWRRGLTALALGGALLPLAACCPDGLVDEIYLIRAPDAELQKLIDSCRAKTATGCFDLCTRVTGGASYAFEHCELHPDSHGYVQVHVGYHSGYQCE